MTKRTEGTIISAPIVAGEDTNDDLASAIGRELQGGFQRFATIAERDVWTSKYKSRLYRTTAHVEANDDGDPVTYKWDGVQEDGSDGSWQEISLDAPPTTTGRSLTLDDGSDDVAGVIKLNVPTSQLTPDPGQPGEATLKPYVTLRNRPSGQNDNNSQEITFQPPLKTFSDPDKQLAGMVYIDPAAYETKLAPGFLAYLNDSVEVVGKLSATNTNTEKSHHDGVLWFDDIVVPTDLYLNTDKAAKSFSIQEADQGDPNVTGGTDYLISFRVHMVGTAPDDGFVRVYLYNASVNPFDPVGYLEDVNSQPLVFERQYKADDELGFVELTGIVNAKGIRSFTCHVVDNFSDDLVKLTDRTQGCTGLMIQALTTTEKTGLALLQYENDTQQNIEFSSHYLGQYRATMGYLNSMNEPLATFPAGQNADTVDGWHTTNINGIRGGIVGGNTVIQDDGTNVCDFAVTRFFDAEETGMLRNRGIDVTVTLVDKDNGYVLALMKWIGKPDEYVKDIFTGRTNGTPNFATNWVKADELFISEDAVSGEHSQVKSFTVPADANNYAVALYPAEAQQPLTLKLKELRVDVADPFTGYSIDAPELIGETHFEYSDQYKEFVQNTQGYAELRYTINDAGGDGLPLPCGIPGKGLADVNIDTSVNQVSGSQAKGGEGGIVFNADGQATINTTLLIQSEKSHATVSQVNFWWAKVGPGNQLQKIDDSEYTVGVRGQTKAVNKMPTFTISVDAGDVIVLRATADQADGAFLVCRSDATPLVKTQVKFKELVVGASDTTDLVSLPFNKFSVVDRREIPFSGVNGSNLVVSNFTLPTDVIIGGFSVVANSAGGVISINDAEYAYDATAQTLTVHVGSASSGVIYLEFWG